MDYRKQYEAWLGYEALEPQMKAELKEIAGDETEIKERFYKDLEFGTAGLRGILGAGINRMNIYTVRRATQGLASFVVSCGQEAMDSGVVISYDSRINSTLFAQETARVLAANGIAVYLSNRLRPVPELSFAVRHYGAAAGVMITASHNPPKYNGYKVYGKDGGQLPLAEADTVLQYIEKTDIFSGVKLCDLEEAIAAGKVKVFGDELDEAFLNEVVKQQVNPEVMQVMKDFQMVYTPIHGSGNIPVRKVLERIGVKHVELVKEQVEPDGNFPTVDSPNPENRSALEMAIALAKEKDIDMLIGTDPDCDRVGVAVRDDNGEYLPLTGNMVGALLVNYVLAGKKLNHTLPENGVVIKTIVTSRMTDAICKDYGVEVMNVLTGFKFIGEKIKEFEQTGDHTYVFGFEESYGYLAGTHARDKDAVVASMLIAEMAAWYKMRGMSLYQGLCELYQKYGTYRERLLSVTLEGADGLEKISQIMAEIRANPPKQVAGLEVVKVADYDNNTVKDLMTGTVTETGLPKSNVLVFDLQQDTWVAMRPSGTEPKIKFYFGTKAENIEVAEARLRQMENEMKLLIER
ncbi:MAG: phospho-sugar mutase [Clostridia bacterium]|nr:phospho-sugar mutase [Clostridia bacterium]